jgi:hypothetical protein
VKLTRDQEARWGCCATCQSTFAGIADRLAVRFGGNRLVVCERCRPIIDEAYERCHLNFRVLPDEVIERGE